MNILYLGRTDKGGIRTHINYLVETFSKNNKVKVLSQEDFDNFNLYDGGYYLDWHGFEKIKGMLNWCDLMHIHHPSSSFEFAIPLIEIDKPIVNTFHFSLTEKDNIFENKSKALNLANKAMINLVGKVYSQKSRKYIAVGSDQKQILSKYNDTVVIHNGISVEKFRKIKTKRYFEDFTIGYLGRVTFEKNVISLIEACQELDINLVVSGIGKDLETLKKKYRSKRLKFLGKQKYPPLEFYNSIDVFCNPSFFEANVNLTVLEAMACKTPVIASGCGGEEKSIKSSFGYISEPDKESLKDTIKKIRRRDLKKMGENARKEVEKDFRIEDMAAKVYSVYEEILD